LLSLIMFIYSDPTPRVKCTFGRLGYQASGYCSAGWRGGGGVFLFSGTDPFTSTPLTLVNVYEKTPAGEVTLDSRFAAS
jgi:hypothetical protein